MASTAQILRNHRTELTEYERVEEFLGIISSLGYDTDVEKDNAIYMKPKGCDDKGVRVWVDQGDHPIFTINGNDYYREVFFDFVWDDERHGIESMNSDMILIIVAEYLKKYPDAYFNYEWSNDDNMFMDIIDFDLLRSQPFQPGWFYLFKSHLHSSRVNEYYDEWRLD